MITLQLDNADAEWVRKISRDHRPTVFAAVTTALGGQPTSVQCFVGTGPFDTGRRCTVVLCSEQEYSDHLIRAHRYLDDAYGEDTAQTNAFTAWRER